MLRPLLVAAVPGAAMAVRHWPELPPLQRGAGDSLHTALAALLTTGGRPQPQELLMGYSGAAFRLAWREHLLWCPSALHVAAEDPFDALGAALGVRWQRRAGYRFAKALELLRRQLALGRPVLTSGVTGAAEWVAVVGVSAVTERPGRWRMEPPSQSVKMTLRTAADDSGRYTQWDSGPWWGYLPGADEALLWSPTPLVWLEAVDAPPPVGEAVAAALARAVRSGRGGRCGAFLTGQAAYEAWVGALGDDDELADVPAAEVERRAWGNALAAAHLVQAREAAVAFLEIGAEAIDPPEARRLVRLAARCYAAVADEARAFHSALSGAGDDGDTERFRDTALRRRAAAQLGGVQRREHTALAYLASAVERIRRG